MSKADAVAAILALGATLYAIFGGDRKSVV